MTELGKELRLPDNYLDEGLRLWIMATAHQNHWRAPAWMSVNDLIQDGFMCYEKCVKRYERLTRNLNPRKHHRRNFMALVKITFTNHIHDLSSTRTEQRERPISSVQGEEDTFESWMDRNGQAEESTAELGILLKQAPLQIQEFLIALKHDAALGPTRGYEDGKRTAAQKAMDLETPNQYACRLANLDPKQVDMVKVLRQYFGVCSEDLGPSSLKVPIKKYVGRVAALKAALDERRAKPSERNVSNENNRRTAMAKKTSLFEELVEALGASAKVGKDPQAYLRTMVKKADALSDKDWEGLSPAAKKWLNVAVGEAEEEVEITAPAGMAGEAEPDSKPSKPGKASKKQAEEVEEDDEDDDEDEEEDVKPRGRGRPSKDKDKDTASKKEAKAKPGKEGKAKKNGKQAKADEDDEDEAPKKKRASSGRTRSEPPFPLKAKIKVLVKTPHREGSEIAARYANLKTGMTCEQAREAGVGWIDLRCDVQRGNLEIK